MDERPQNCYLWIDSELPEDQRIVNVICEECHKKEPDLGWFWEGSKLGYGPFDFICKCGHVVHAGPKSNPNN